MKAATRSLSALAVLAVATMASPGAGVAQSTPVEGAWLVTGWEVDGGTRQAQSGLILFTKTHYSVMFVFGDEPRARYEDSLEGDALSEAYGSFVANTGRYVVEGDQIKTRAYVAKDPNYMGDWPENESTYTYRIDDEGMLHLTFGAGGPGAGTTAILRPVDDAEMGGQ